MEHLYTTPKEKKDEINRTIKHFGKDKIIAENYEYFMRYGTPIPTDVPTILAPNRKNNYCFLLDRFITKEITRALNGKRQLTDMDFIHSFYDEEKQEYRFARAISAKSLDVFLEECEKIFGYIYID